jgi:serine/threonine-protein kinase
VPEHLLGQILGNRYRLTRLIGAGAYAWVYEALDTELEIPVAVKVLRPEHTGNDVTETRFRREATTAARLRHPHIVGIRDVGRSDGATWVVMDLLPGSLSRRLQLLPALPEPEVVRIGLDVAAALAAAHAAGIIHRDVKPDNILLGASGEAVVCDFGLARALASGADLSATNQVVGTPHYFSPEQARGESLDGRSDLYALGVTLFRSATGRLPFEGDDWYAVARQHVESAPPDPRALAPQLTAEFAAILTRLLAKRAEDRYATARDLALALAALPTAPSSGAALAIAGAETTAVHPALARRRPRRVRTALTTTLGLALLAALVWLAQGAPSGATVWARVRPTPVDSVRIDSVVPAASDTTTRDTTPAVVDSARAESARIAPAPAPRPGTLRISAPEGAEVRLDGLQLETLPYTATKLASGPHVVIARLISGPGLADCRWAEAVDTVVLRAGERRDLEVDLGRCTRLVVNVTPPDARLTLSDERGTTLSRTAGLPFILRTGIWTIRATAPRCAPFEGADTLRAGDDTLNIVMLCR